MPLPGWPGCCCWWLLTWPWGGPQPCWYGWWGGYWECGGGPPTWFGMRWPGYPPGPPATLFGGGPGGGGCPGWPPGPPGEGPYAPGYCGRGE